MKKKRKSKKGFGLKDFVSSVDKVMQKQEKENPALRQVHARLSPEWKRVSEKIGKLLALAQAAPSPRSGREGGPPTALPAGGATLAPEIEKLREEVVAEGETATRVLIDFLLALVRKANPPAGEEPPQP